MISRKCDNLNTGNKGFTLVELLVGVVILAIASAGIIQAFTMAGIINAKAQKKQNATSLAESVLEEIKSSSITQLKSRYSTSSGDITVSGAVVNDAAFSGKTAKERAKIASDLLSGSEGFFSHESDKPYYYVLCKTGQSVTVDPAISGNDTYTVTATMRTEPYRQTASGDASDANSIKLPVIEDIDAHKKAVLSDKELNKFDAAAADYFNMHSWFDTTLAVGKKEIYIEKSGDGSAGSTAPINVKCTVTYTANDDMTKYKKEVFNGTYASEKDSEGNFLKVDNDIYIFYNRLLSSNEHITVKDSSVNDDHKVYVVFQKKRVINTDSGDHAVYKDSDDFIDNLSGTTIVIKNGGGAEVIKATTNGDIKYTNSDGDVVNGRRKETSSGDDYWLITNLPASPGSEGDFSERSSKNRLFEVTVEVTKPDDDTVYATLTSTVNVRE